MGSCFSRSSSQGDEDDEPARVSLPASGGADAVTLPNTVPQESDDGSETCSEASSDSGLEKSTKEDLYQAIRNDGDLEKVKRLIKEHPNLLR